ncbi:MAG: hypothetical protein MUQ25_19785, partial [Candidatus Aminicenantes bacterium]|nr:hypothetical protein [Candidatus Aminicenantes bacterium]
GNKFSGEASFYYTNKSLSQIHLPNPDLQALNLAKPSIPVFAIDTSWAVGGPIIKDKIWFMSEFRYLNSKRTGDFRPTVINGKQYDNYDKPFPGYVDFLNFAAQLTKNIRASAMGYFSMQDVPYYYSGWYLSDEANKHNKPIRLNYSSTILDLRAPGLYFKWSGVNTKEADPNGPHFIDDYTGCVWGNTGPDEYTYKLKFNVSLTLTKFMDDFLGGSHKFKVGLEWERNRGDWGFYMNQPLFWYYYDGNLYYYSAQNGGVTEPAYGDGLLEYLTIGTTSGSGAEIGIIQEGFPTATFSGMYPLTWRPFTWNWWDLNDNRVPDIPGVDKYQEAYDDTPLAMISKAYLDAIDPNVKVPYVNDITVGIDYELVKDLRIGARYIHKDRRRVLGSVLYDKESGRYCYTHDLAPEWWIPFTTTIPDCGDYPAQQVTMCFLSNDAPAQERRLTNIPEGRMKYHSFEVSFDKRMSNGWQLGGSINLSKSTGNFPVSPSGRG